MHYVITLKYTKLLCSPRSIINSRHMLRYQIRYDLFSAYLNAY